MARRFFNSARGWVRLIAVLAIGAAACAPTGASALPSVFSFGSNNFGRTSMNTAIGNTLTATPIDTTNLAGKTITQVDVGGHLSLLLAHDGTVFSSGSNASGRTGLNTQAGNTLTATPIVTTNLAGKTITQVAAGNNHSLLLAHDGTVFSFGENSGGQTGLNTNSGATLLATPIDTTNLAGKTITQVAVGNAHSLLLAHDGTVFSFGHNFGGKTGLNATSGETLIATPIDTTNLVGKTIKQVAAGYEHSLLLADDGTVFSFGWNDSGRTGLNTVNGSTSVATPINTANLAGKVITQIATTEDHSLLLAHDGTVFSFGVNADGRTGLNTVLGSTLVATPIDTTNLAGKVITQVAAGGAHSLLLAHDGSVFSFGVNNAGVTGLNTIAGTTPVATPIDTTNLAGKVITQITAGQFHNLLLAVPEPSSATLATLLPLLLHRPFCRRIWQARPIA